MIPINCSVSIVQGLMRELELREKKVNDIQALGDKLVKDGHPGKKTVEVFTLPKPRSRVKNSHIHLICCHHVLSTIRRPSQLLCRPSGAGSFSCAAVSRLISKKTQPTTRYATPTLQFQSLHHKNLSVSVDYLSVSNCIPLWFPWLVVLCRC